jgi:hypothetical protein
MRKISAALLLLLLLITAGCYIPEQFDAKILINKDGSYSFTYDGTLTNFMVLAAAKEKALTAKDEADLKKAVSEFSKTPEFKKVEYQGKGRYKVLVQKTGKKGEPYYFLSQDLNYISVVPKPDGTMEVRSFSPSAKDLKDLKQIDAKIDGKLMVKLPRGMKVLQTNAQGKPKFFGLIGGYTWSIKKPEDAPFIILKP